MPKIRVGVLRGGPSTEYEESLQTGQTVLQHLPMHKYEPLDIFITRDGLWHHRGVAVEPNRLFPRVDVFFIALHGDFGASGQIQRFLSQFGLRYTGSPAVASAVSLNKSHARLILKNMGLPTTDHVLLQVAEDINSQLSNTYQTLKGPWLIKPNSRKSTHGTLYANSYSGLVRNVRTTFENSEKVLVEPHQSDQRAKCLVLEKFRGTSLYAFPPIEVRTKTKFETNTDVESPLIVEEEYNPSSFTRDQTSEIERLAKLAHETLDLKHYSTTEWLVLPEGIYFQEVDTLPEISLTSPVARSLSAVGSSLPEFTDHLVSLAT